MKIQDAIKLITEHNEWTFEGSFTRAHPINPASCGGGGGLRERRYKFICKSGIANDFNSRSVRLLARQLQNAYKVQP